MTRSTAIPLRRLAGVAVVIVAALSAAGGAERARAQDIPACTPSIAGALTCLQNTVCECTFHRGGRLSGQPSGWRWDCDLLRPRCGNLGAGVPATINPYTGDWPNSVVIDRSTESTVIDNTNTNTNTSQQQTGDGTVTGGAAGGDLQIQDTPPAED